MRLFNLIILLGALQINTPHALKASNGNLPDNMPANEVMFVGAHNAAMSSAEGWVYAQQSQDLEGLWKAGVRSAKIPLHWYQPEDPVHPVGLAKKGLSILKGIVKGKIEPAKPYLALCHEFPANNNCRLTVLQRAGKPPQDSLQFFTRLAKLMSENPKEVFILILESYTNQRSKTNGAAQYSDADARQILQADLEKSGLARFAYKLTASQSTQNASWPTLGDLRKQQKRVIIFTTNMQDVEGSSYLNPLHSFFRSTHWETAKIENCGMADDHTPAGLFHMGVGPEASIPHDSVLGKGLKMINKIKNTGIVQQSDYAKVNSKEEILKRIEKCHAVQPDAKHPNIISGDYVEKGDMKNVINDLNAKHAEKYTNKK
jgi:hypothetical protein